MKIVIVTLLILSLTIPAYGGSFERDVSIEFDGDIEYNSIHGSTVGETVVDVKGTGEGDITQSAEADDGSLNHAAEVEVTSGDAVGDSNIEATVGAKSSIGVYVSKVEPEAGETALLDQMVEISNDTFAELIYGTRTEITQGIVQRSVGLSNEDTFISESLRLVGMGRLYDQLQFELEEEE